MRGTSGRLKGEGKSRLSRSLSSARGTNAVPSSRACRILEGGGNKKGQRTRPRICGAESKKIRDKTARRAIPAESQERELGGEGRKRTPGGERGKGRWAIKLLLLILFFSESVARKCCRKRNRVESSEITKKKKRKSGSVHFYDERTEEPS